MSKGARIQLGAAVAVSFFCGMLFAKGFDLTRLSWAQASRSLQIKTPPPAVKSLDDFSNAFEYVANTVTPTVVSIQAEQTPKRASRQQQRRLPPNLPPGMEQFFQPFEQQDPTPRESGGSGFIVSKDGYILTNNHVVADADKISVRLHDNRVLDAKVIGRDPTTDVALIKIDATNLPVAMLGEDSTAHIGQWVVAIGNPLDLGITVTAGIVSAKGRQLGSLLNPDNQNPYAIMDYIQTDAAINPGNSGGPLANIHGQVIGINSAIASSNGGYQGYGFAIPITLAKRVMDDLIQYGAVRRAVLGVQIDTVSPATAKAAGLSEIRGVLVNGFDPEDDSPAKRAGMQEGDVITAVEGQTVDGIPALQRLIREYKPGQTVSLDVMRFGSKKAIAVKLGEPPKVTDVALAANDVPAEPKPVESASADRLGISVAPVPADLLKQANVPVDYRRGLLITSVKTSGPGYRAFDTNADIIVRCISPKHEEIHTAADLQEVLTLVKRGDAVSLLVYNTGAQRTRVVNLQLP